MYITYLYCTAKTYLLQIFKIAPYIPIAEARGFTVQFDKKEHENVYLGRFNYYDNERAKVIDGSGPVYKEYDGYVYNFECDYCVPVKDEVLEKYIRSWNVKADVADLNNAQKRIEELGGILFLWK